MGDRDTISRVRPDWLLPHDEQGMPEALGLCIAWSAAEPDRIGEVGLIRPGIPLFVLGRGGPADSDRTERLLFYRQRPGGNMPAPPIEGPGISRNQLLVRPSPEGLEVERIGRCPLSINGREVDRGTVRPEDVVGLKHQLVLTCVRRPLRFRAPRPNDARGAHAFGSPDEHGIVGESLAIADLRDQLAFCARSDNHVLILGESGCGKELAARALHRLSRRRDRAMVSRNAATFPPGIIDAELFGNVKDYPNAGMDARPGMIGEADGSTLFLDEIAELSKDLQAHLMRVLDVGGEYQRLGEARPRRADLRLIAATNRDPSELKHDLLGRLTLRVTLPGLQDRREDIPLLVRHLLQRAAAKNPEIAEQFFEPASPTGTPRLDPELVTALLRHRFTHHVRQLDAMLWLAISGSHERYVALTPEVRAMLRAEEPPAVVRTGEPTVEEIQAACERHGGNLSKAWQDLGLKSRYALYRLMTKYGLRRRGGEIGEADPDEGEPDA